MKIRSTSKAFNTWLGTVLKPYKVRKPSAQTWYSVLIAGGDPDEEKKSKRRFHILYRGSTQVIRTLDLDTLGRALFADLEATMFEDRDDAVYLEMAALSKGDRVALLPGRLLPSMWKLSRRLHQVGIQLPLARTVAVEKGTGKIVPTKPRLEVPDDALAQLTDAVGSEAAAILGVAGKGAAGNGYLERWAVEAPTQAVAILTSGGDDEPRQPQSRGETVYRMAGMTMNIPSVGVTALESLSLLAEPAECFKFYGATGLPEQRTRVLNDLTATLGA
jgi:hypothetical protein